MLMGRQIARRTVDPRGTYAESLEITGAARLVFISGQVPTDPDGAVPSEFAVQCRNSWRRVLEVLAQHDMQITNLVKITTFLRDRHDKEENRTIRQEVLGGHLPALTVVMVDLFETDWLIEIEAIAIG